MQTSQIRTPKTFYLQERDTAYVRWRAAFWRELFQNACDAGAKNIDIRVATQRGKGSFGRPATVGEVVRVTFADDGHGMTEDVIDNVYFQPGESTKRGVDESIGGFGRARLILNWAQVRYRFYTNDRFVEGDGPEYLHHDFAQMVAVFVEQRDRLAQEFAASSDESVAARIKDLDEDIDLARSLASNGRVKGVTMEIDLNPEEYGADSYRNPTLDRMLGELNNYLTTAQLGCKVFINGDEFKAPLMRGPVKRQLVAKLENGEERVFGALHTNRSDKAPYKKRMLVRVRGATMFDVAVQPDMQVILELDPRYARDVLTANRDGFASPYDDVVEELKTELAVDVQSALDERKHDVITIEGRLGRLTAQRPENISLAPEADEAEDVRPPPPVAAAARPYDGGNSAAASQLEAFGYAGVPFAVWRNFLSSVKWGEMTFVSEFARDRLRSRLETATAGRHGVEMVRSAIEAMSQEDRDFVVGTILARMQAKEAEDRAAFEKKLAGLPDIRVHTHGEVKGKLRDAMRRNDPRKWDPETGAGQRARAVLAAWTVCCEVAISTLMRFRPEAVKDTSFEWAPGFLYSAPEAEYRYDTHYEASVREAEFVKTDSGERYILINPVDSEGALRFNPRKPEDLQYLAMLAAHEVAHLSKSYHDEDFANLMTGIAGRLDMREIRTRTMAALADIKAIYSAGRVRSQALDETTGPRPSERLAACAFPDAAITASILASPENEHLASANLAIFRSAFNLDDDGVVEVESETLKALDETLSNTDDYEHAAAPAL